MVDGPAAVPMDLYKTSNADEVEHLVLQLFRQIVKEPGVYQRAPTNSDSLKAAIRVVCLNVLAASYVHPGAYIFYSRSRDDYSKRPVSYRAVTRAVDGLRALGYIEHQTGSWHGSDQEGIRSRLKGTKKLLRMITDSGVAFHMISVHRSFKLIDLRDENKKSKPLPTSDRAQREIRRMRKNLEKINDSIAKSFIGLRISDDALKEMNKRLSGSEDRQVVDFTKKRLYRVFNESMKCGGRFYGGWWQNVPKELRKYIHIAHQNRGIAKYVQEVDYSNMQPAIAYARKGLALEDDAYATPSTTNSSCPDRMRDIAKKALLCMFNNESRKAAIAAVHKSLRKEYRKQHPEKPVPPIKERLPEGAPSIGQLIDELYAKHEPIHDIFYTCVGVKLMYEESQIAEEIMLQMAARGVVVLPVHDSFLVIRSWAHTEGGIDDAMKKVFEQRYRVECWIEFDETVRSEWTTSSKPRLDIEDFDNYSHERRQQSIFYDFFDQWHKADTHRQKKIMERYARKSCTTDFGGLFNKETGVWETFKTETEFSEAVNTMSDRFEDDVE